ncbi:hypothetical protein CRG98_005587 [Punica granatum]|uniref:Uncharacterized protein n=1 Tax=Punica granatum TaxID=22663 RepID=A0A2I0L061_PUNGR|nr:hypothetical protein CRG98_005587 [Punica granatum]
MGQMSLSTKNLTKRCGMTWPVTQLTEDHGLGPKMLNYTETGAAKWDWATSNEVGPRKRPSEKARVTSLTRMHLIQTGIDSRPEALNFLHVRLEAFTFPTQDLIRVKSTFSVRSFTREGPSEAL